MAWSRSGLSLLVCGAFVLRGLIGVPSIAPSSVAGGLILALGIATTMMGAWYGRRRRRRGQAVATPRDLLPVSAGVALVGMAAVIVAAAR